MWGGIEGGPLLHSDVESSGEQFKTRQTARGIRMEEQELLKMIAFALKESADRITALAKEVPSSSLRSRLFELSEQLVQKAGGLERGEI